MIGKKETIKKLFNDLVGTSRLAEESNTTLWQGCNLLNEAENQTEVDKILVGILLLALWRNDMKYGYDDGGIENLDKAISAEKHIWGRPILVGEKALFDKTIPFEGRFSNNLTIQSMISNALLEIKEVYFEEYGILASMKLEEEEITSAFVLF